MDLQNSPQTLARARARWTLRETNQILLAMRIFC